MVLLHTPPGELGAPAPDFDLLGVDGQHYQLDSFAEAPVLVVMFICNHCPYVQTLEQRLIQLAREMIPSGVAMVAISSNDAVSYPADGYDNMKQRAAEKGYPFPYLYDEDQEVARAYGAVCTPDFFVYDRDRTLRYRGRLDDSPRNPAAVTREELKAALLALLDGQAVPEPQHASMGCSLKWKGDPPG